MMKGEWEVELNSTPNSQLHLKWSQTPTRGGLKSTRVAAPSHMRQEGRELTQGNIEDINRELKLELMA